MNVQYRAECLTVDSIYTANAVGIHTVQLGTSRSAASCACDASAQALRSVHASNFYTIYLTSVQHSMKLEVALELNQSISLIAHAHTHVHTMYTTAGSASRKQAEQEAAISAAAVTEKAVTQPVAAAVTPVIETPLLPPLDQLRALIASSKGQGGGIDVEHVRR
jgi:hypothetical protein